MLQRPNFCEYFAFDWHFNHTAFFLFLRASDLYRGNDIVASLQVNVTTIFMHFLHCPPDRTITFQWERPDIAPLAVLQRKIAIPRRTLLLTDENLWSIKFVGCGSAMWDRCHSLRPRAKANSLMHIVICSIDVHRRSQLRNAVTVYPERIILLFFASDAGRIRDEDRHTAPIHFFELNSFAATP